MNVRSGMLSTPRVGAVAPAQPVSEHQQGERGDHLLDAWTTQAEWTALQQAALVSESCRNQDRARRLMGVAS